MDGLLAGPSKRFCWNIGANVGPGCPNRIDNVHLVQLGYACKAVIVESTSAEMMFTRCRWPFARTRKRAAAFRMGVLARFEIPPEPTARI